MTETDITPTVLLTGPTSGIGAKILEALAAHPSRPSLVLMGRDPTALERAAAKAGVKGLATRCLRVDLADLDSVRGALERLTEVRTAGALGRVDVAILNAGSQFTTRRKAGPQGYESTFTTNVISQHLLLCGLERQLAPGGHVVLMGSSTHRGKKASFNLVPDPEWADPADLAAPDPSTSQPLPQAQERERGGVAYATSKLALVTLSHDWAARLGEAGRRLNTYDPGLVAGTGLARDLPAHRYWVWKHLMPAMRVLPGATTATRSAGHAARLAMSDTHPTVHGAYIELGKLTAAEPVTFDPARRAALWEWLEGAVAEWLPTDVRPATLGHPRVELRGAAGGASPL